MASSSVLPSNIKKNSHNVQGLNSQTKCIKAFSFYLSLGADIVALQETHFLHSFVPKYLHRWFPVCYYANASEKSRLDMHKAIPLLSFTEHKIIRDNEGHYLLVKQLLGEDLVTFLIYYAPNSKSFLFSTFWNWRYTQIGWRY